MLPIRHKFNAKQTVVDDKKFRSKKEALWFHKLKHRQVAGEVLFFLREVPFELPGGIKYRLDFMVFCADGTVELIEVKGFMTDTARIKLAQTEEIYGVTINVV